MLGTVRREPFVARAAAPTGARFTVSLAQLFGAAADVRYPSKNFGALEHKYSESALVYTCISRKAKDLARAPLRGMRAVVRGGKEALEPLEARHPLATILKKVSEYGATQEWLVQITSMYFDLVGNAFWLVVRDRRTGLPVELYPVNPLAVAIYPERYEAFHYGRYIPFRKFTARGRGDVLHFRLPSPVSDFGSMFPSEWGAGPLEATWDLVVTDQDAVKWNRNILKNDGAPAGVLISEQEVSPEEAQAGAELFRQTFGGSQNSGKTLVMGKGMTYERIALTPHELDYGRSREALREDIMTAFDMNPAVLGFAQGDVGRRDEQIRTYWQSGIVSRSTAHLLPVLNEFLAPEFGNDVVIVQDFSTIRELQENDQQRAAVAREFWALGAPFDVLNERFQLGFPPFPGSEKGFLPFSVAPVEQVLAGPQPPALPGEAPGGPTVPPPGGGEGGAEPEEDDEEPASEEPVEGETPARRAARVAARKIAALVLAPARAAKVDDRGALLRLARRFLEQRAEAPAPVVPAPVPAQRVRRVEIERDADGAITALTEEVD